VTQLVVLSGIAIAMTAGVYGLVAGIVKLDDAGLYLAQRQGEGAGDRFKRILGSAIVLAAPWLMKGLSVAGTIAMFLVGGGILTHGVGPLHQPIEQLTSAAGALAPVLPLLIDLLVGLVAGAVVLTGVNLVKKMLPAKSKADAAA
jgi:hypothetical protein